MFSIEKLKTYCKQYHERIVSLENQKFDLEHQVKKKDLEVRFTLGSARVIIDFFTLYMHDCSICCIYSARLDIEKNSDLHIHVSESSFNHH